jgi:hypothetical protein
MHRIRRFLRIQVCEKLRERSTYWQRTWEEALRVGRDTHDALFFLRRINAISQKLQTEEFQTKVVRELKSFYTD